MSWECHRCGTVHADWSNACWCRPPTVTGTCTVTITPTTEADRLTLLERQMRTLEVWRDWLDGGAPRWGEVFDAIKACIGPDGEGVE